MKKTSLLLSTIAALLAGFNLYAQQYPGYTLYSLQNSNNAYLLDTNGTTYKTWTFTSSPTGYSTYMEPGGTLVRTVKITNSTFNGGGMTGKVQKVNYNGTVTWNYTHSSSTYNLHHDICPMPNGNVLMISYELKSATEASAAGCTQAITIWSEKIIEVKPTGTTSGDIVWEWHLWDHLVQNTDPTKANYQSSIVDHPELLNINYSTQKDWIHMNGIDYNPILDQIVVSSHNLNQWFVIDHSTTTTEAASHSGGNAGKGGDFLYRYGNPASYGATGSTVLNVTHDAHWIPEGVPNAGRLVGFNNKGVSSSKSSVDQIQPPINGYNYNLNPGSAYQPLTYLERHACNGYTSNMGNSQQLPNGNMLVCLATAGTIYEIDSAGTSLWSKTLTGSVPQAFRYNDCYITNTAPPIPTITENNDTLKADSATTYQWYLNGVLLNGETNATLLPAQSGVYIVRITDGNGCVYRYSAGYKFTYTDPTGVTENSFSKVVVYPNPASNILTIGLSNSNYSDFKVSMHDASGRIVFTAENQNQVDLTTFTNGIYFVIVSAENIGTITKRIIITK